jgi:ATP-dependent DNA helicase RecG
MKTLDISRLENQELEYKLTLPETEQLARLFVAMANTKGGTIIIGVREDPLEVVGFTPNQRIEEHIANVAAETCTPAISYQISYQTLEQKTGTQKTGAQKTVMLIEVASGLSKPYSIKKLGVDRGAFVRIGSTCRVADREMLKRLMREGSQRSFDSELSTLPTSVLNKALFEEYLSRRKARLGSPPATLKDELLIDLNLAEGRNLTITGALLFSHEPQRDPQLTGALIRAARFKGTERGIFIDQQEISGDLPQQIEYAVKFILRNIPLKATQKGLSRVDLYDYPIEVLRELITNAVVHRDYSMSHENIQLAVFDDRIEVTSPGGLPGTLTVENFIHRQHSRNPILAKRMFEMGYLEAWGLGIDTIINWSKNTGKRAPLFSDNDNQFTCTIYAAQVSAHTIKDLTPAEQSILHHFSEYEALNNRQLRDLCQLTKTQVHSALSKLLRRKLISRKGRGPAVCYFVKGERA